MQLYSGNFTSTKGEWYEVNLGFKPKYVQLITNDTALIILYDAVKSATTWILSATNSRYTNNLGTTQTANINFDITDNGFKYYRNQTNDLTVKWFASKDSTQK